MTKKVKKSGAKSGIRRVVIDGVCFVPVVSDYDVAVDRLHKAFLADDPLAPFRCADLWKREGLPFSDLPKWVVEAAGDVYATYYRKRAECIEADALRYDEQRRRGKETPHPSTHEHEKVSKWPSLERIAGLSRGKKFDPFRSPAEGAALFAEWHSRLVGEAKDKSPGNDTFPGRAGPVKVLDGRNRPTREFTVALLREFGKRGNSFQADYRKARRMLQSNSDK